MHSISIPKNVNISWGEDYIQISGILGTVVKKKSEISFAVKDSKLYIWSSKHENANIFLSYIKDIFIGVTQGYRQKLKLVGVGFKAIIENNALKLKIGFSHEVLYHIPADIKILCSKAKGTIILLKGIENYRVNQIAAEIRSLRLPDSYKGKGIHYENEILKLKKGKREGK